MDAQKLAFFCRKMADAKKAENLVILDMRELTSVADYFVIGTGSSEPHLRAIVDEITEKLRLQHGVRPRAIDGTLHTAWIVLDFGDVLVHVMRADQREKYDLEGLWGDAPRLETGTVGSQTRAKPTRRLVGKSKSPVAKTARPSRTKTRKTGQGLSPAS
jgi:ribosome-associated protein